MPLLSHKSRYFTSYLNLWRSIAGQKLVPQSGAMTDASPVIARSGAMTGLFAITGKRDQIIAMPPFTCRVWPVT